MSDVVNAFPLVAGDPDISGVVETRQSTQIGDDEVRIYLSVSWLKSGTVPSTVTLDLSFSYRGEIRVHRMTEVSQGSPFKTMSASIRQSVVAITYRSDTMGKV